SSFRPVTPRRSPPRSRGFWATPPRAPVWARRGAPSSSGGTRARAWPRPSSPATRGSWPQEREGLRPRVRPRGQRDGPRGPARAAPGGPLGGRGRGPEVRPRALEAGAGRGRRPPRDPGGEVPRLSRRGAGAPRSRGRRHHPRVEAPADELRPRAPGAGAPAAAVAARYRRLGARFLLSGGRLGARGPGARSGGPERARVDVADGEARGAGRRAHRGLALPRGALRRRARHPRA